MGCERENFFSLPSCYHRQTTKKRCWLIYDCCVVFPPLIVDRCYQLLLILKVELFSGDLLVAFGAKYYKSTRLNEFFNRSRLSDTTEGFFIRWKLKQLTQYLQAIYWWRNFATHNRDFRVVFTYQSIIDFRRTKKNFRETHKKKNFDPGECNKEISFDAFAIMLHNIFFVWIKNSKTTRSRLEICL